MDKKVIAAVICVVVVGAALGAYFIATPAPQIEQKQSEITVTDLAGRTVTIKNVPVERIVLQSSGSGGAFYTLFALEGKDAYKKIVGIDPGLKKFRYDIWETYVSVMPELENIPDIGTIGDGTFGIEKVITLNPDVLICPLHSQKQAEDTVKKLEEAGIQTVFIDYHAETLENHMKSITLLGKILGKEERAKELVDFYKEQVDKVTSRLTEINKPKPRVYVECGMTGPSEYSNTYGNFMWGAMIVKCGGINIAEGKVEKYAPINPEYLLAANPDVIIITGAYWPAEPTSFRLGYATTLEDARKSLNPFTERPGWDTLSAVKKHRVYGIYHGISRDIWDFAPKQYMAKCFYPDEFKDLDPEKNLKEFYERFLPVDYSGMWMMSLEEKRKAITVTDLAGRQVTVKVPVERVVLASSRHTHEFAAVEGGEDPFKKIAGWGPDLKNYDRDTYNKYKEKFPEIEDIPEVGYHYEGTFSVEKVITLKPDVVVFPLWIVDYEGVNDDINKLKKAGIPTIYIDYWKEPFENPVESTLLLGTVLGKEERAQDIVDFYIEQTNEVYSRIKKIDKPKPKVYVECGSKEPSEYGNTYGSDKGWGAVVVICGGTNIAEDIPGGPINPEYLLDANPDVIMISGSYWPATPGSMRLGYYADPKESRELLMAFTERSGWDTLNATKNHRVHSVFHGFSFRIYNFAGLQAFAKWFYPEEFADLDPEERFKEFHERFLPVDYSGVWMMSLEEE